MDGDVILVCSNGCRNADWSLINGVNVNWSYFTGSSSSVSAGSTANNGRVYIIDGRFMYHSVPCNHYQPGYDVGVEMISYITRKVSTVTDVSPDLLDCGFGIHQYNYNAVQRNSIYKSYMDSPVVGDHIDTTIDTRDWSYR